MGRQGARHLRVQVVHGEGVEKARRHAPRRLQPLGAERDHGGKEEEEEGGDHEQGAGGVRALMLWKSKV